MKTRFALMACSLAMSLLPACGVYQARTLGKEEARRFHEQLNASRCADIYNSSAPEFRRSGTEQQWIAFCTEVRARCGRWMTSQPKGQESEVWLVDSGGYIVTINYVSQFELGVAEETLRFAVRDGKVSLVSYNVVSPLLGRQSVTALYWPYVSGIERGRRDPGSTC